MPDCRCVVLTTIFPPTEPVRRFAALPGWHAIVVGDQKTPAGWSCPGATYLGPADQDRLFPELSRRLPWNHYARKNLGYLYALREGATLIADADDDNLPLEGWAEMPARGLTVESQIRSPEFPNVYRVFGEPVAWPRGFPLDRIRADEPVLLEKVPPTPLGVLQGLVEGDADVDAIFRLTQRRPVAFHDHPPVGLAEGVWSPFNSQNTWWRREAAPFLWLPCTASFRYTDILRSWLAQQGLWRSGLRLGFAAVSARQERNAHDLLADFASEVPCYLESLSVIAVLRSMSLPAGDPLRSLQLMTEALAERALLGKTEPELVAAWCRAFPK